MPQNTPDTIRLNKFIAQNGVASRRGADELVFAGRVTVNGQKADSPGVQVDPDRDEVAVDGKRVGAKAAPADITLMLHKPVETVTTAKDPQGRTTVLDLLPADIVDKRPFPVGRLDFYSEGLLLLTTDGDLCYRLTHPKYHLPKVYVVTVRGIVPPAAEAAMRKGMKLKDGVQLAPAKVLVKRPVAGTQQVGGAGADHPAPETRQPGAPGTRQPQARPVARTLRQGTRGPETGGGTGLAGSASSLPCRAKEWW
jgi:23S rRNA pseudouridine2605 synthase